MIEGIVFLVLGVIGIIQYLFCPVYVGIGTNSLMFRMVCTTGSNFLILFSIVLVIIGGAYLWMVHKGIAEYMSEGKNTTILIVVMQLLCLVLSIL